MIWPMNPRKPKPDVAFCDRAYFLGLRGPGGKWLFRPGSWHTGIDINGPGGGDTDLGQPVHSITTGTVVYAGLGRGNAWGNLVVIHHPGPKVWTRYAHLNQIFVRLGDPVSVGQIIGSVGKGWQRRFPAHLHFDVIYREPPILELQGIDWSDWPGYNLARVKATYVDPVKFLTKMQAGEPSRWQGGTNGSSV